MSAANKLKEQIDTRWAEGWNKKKENKECKLENER